MIKLNLGCANDYRRGWLNCDKSKEVNPDQVVDLEKKLPFKDNSVFRILISHTLEHINNFVPLMHELHRVCEPGSKIEVLVPFYSSWAQYNDPTHVRFFTPFTFNYFKKHKFSHEVNSNKNMFHVEMVRINFGKGVSSKLNWLFNPIINLNHKFYCRFFAWIFPATEIYFKLRVIKEVKNEK